jgi:AsmA protein
VVASIEGQGGKKDLQGPGVPVAINGPWAQPSIYPDIAGILENPQAAYEKLTGGVLVKLPDADGLGDTLSSTGGIAGLKGKAGGLIEDLIHAYEGSPQKSEVQRLERLFVADQAPVAAPAEPAAPPVKGPIKKKCRPRQRGRLRNRSAALQLSRRPSPRQSPPAPSDRRRLQDSLQSEA